MFHSDLCYVSFHCLWFAEKHLIEFVELVVSTIGLDNNEA